MIVPEDSPGWSLSDLILGRGRAGVGTLPPLIRLPSFVISFAPRQSSAYARFHGSAPQASAPETPAYLGSSLASRAPSLACPRPRPQRVICAFLERSAGEECGCSAREQLRVQEWSRAACILSVQGQSMMADSKIRIAVEPVDILRFDGDVLELKYAQELHGVDRIVYGCPTSLK